MPAGADSTVYRFTNLPMTILFMSFDFSLRWPPMGKLGSLFLRSLSRLRHFFVIRTSAFTQLLFCLSLSNTSLCPSPSSKSSYLRPDHSPSAQHSFALNPALTPTIPSDLRPDLACILHSLPFHSVSVHTIGLVPFLKSFTPYLPYSILNYAFVPKIYIR